MKIIDIPQQRLVQQCIVNPQSTPSDVVKFLGAVQAQDYLGALWAVGLRTKGATEKSVEEALAQGSIVRTWPMRGTLHFVAAEDVRWMLTLMTPRVIAKVQGRYKQLELTPTVFERAGKIIVSALVGGKRLTRKEIYQLLEEAGISTENSRGLHILGHLSMERLICFGPRDGKQQTMVLLDEWIAPSRQLSREESLAEITKHYFIGHGPATIQDFVWWTGLTVTDAKNGLELAKDSLHHETINDKKYWFSPKSLSLKQKSSAIALLPSFDEYLVGYKDRTDVLEVIYNQKVNSGMNGMFSPVVVRDGQVIATWKRVLQKETVDVAYHPFTSFTSEDQQAMMIEAKKYAHFLGMKLREN